MKNYKMGTLKTSYFFLNLFIMVILFNISFYPQTQVILSENFEDNIELSDDWIVVNGTETNYWVLHDFFDSTNYNTKTAAIRNNNPSFRPQYNTDSASIVHFYKEVTFPSFFPEFELSFKWLCSGQPGDYFSVYLAPTSFTPIAGEEIPADYR